MSGDPLNYQAMTEDALRGVVRAAFQVAEKRGLPGQHHFYLTFRTGYPGVEMADQLRARHPEEMTIVLQHQFWGLEVTPERISVTLSFNGKQERLVIPLASVSAFVDPSVEFGLQFSVAAPANAPASLKPVAALPAAAAAPNGADKPAPGQLPGSEATEAPTGARVVALDAFRKSDARKK